MRVCYFIPGALSRQSGGAEEIERRRARLASLAAPGTEVAVRDAADGPPSVESDAEERLAAAVTERALPGLESEGFDAVIVGCFGDPGLSAARQKVGVPVVGPARASVRAATRLGDRFGILTVVDEVVPGLRRLVRGYGMERHMASLRAVEVPVLELRDRREEVLGRLAAEGEAALEEGADVLILGCMTMGYLDVAPALQERLGVAVVDPVAAALRAAEDAAGAAASAEVAISGSGPAEPVDPRLPG